MSSSTSSAPEGTRSALPEDRSSITWTSKPSASSLSATCEPMNPAPPVTIAALLTGATLANREAAALGGRRGLRPGLEELFDRLDGLVDALEHAHPAALARQAPADRRAGKHDRNLRVRAA